MVSLNMKENTVFFPCGRLTMEGLYAATDGSRGAVVSHPHPQMGGCMMNNVVEAMTLAFLGEGFSTLRFNFRGVESSEGAYDEGRGEQDDVVAARAFMEESGKREIALAGYSFGAWVNCSVIGRDDNFSPVILVAPPVDLFPFDPSSLQGKVTLIISGDRDQFSSPATLKKLAGVVDCPLRIVAGADHFFVEREGEIIQHIRDYLSGSVMKNT